MKKHFKAALAAVLALCMALASIPVSALPIIADSPTQIALDDAVQFDGDSNDHSIEQMRSISIGDYITLGNYLGEPIIWRCVDIDDNGPLMLSDRILCLKCYDANGESELHNDGWGYIRSNYGSNCWYDSNIRQWLNSNELNVSWTHCAPNSANTQYGTNGYSDEPGFLTYFSDSELNYIKAVSHKVYINSWETTRPGYCDGGTFEAFASGGNYYLDSISISDFDGAYYADVSDRFFIPGCDQLLRVYQNLGEYVYSRPTQAAVNNCDYVLSDSFDTNNIFPYWLSSSNNTGASYESVLFMDADSLRISTARAYNDQLGLRPAFYLNTNQYTPSPEHSVCLATLECIDEGHYTGNQGDSRVYRLDKEPFIGYAPYGPAGTYGNGNVLAGTGEEVNNGLEVWLARWNGSPEISYAYRTFKLDGKYSLLRGSIGLVDSYNTTDFDVSLFIYGDGSLLSEYCLTPENVDCSEGIYLDEVQGVNELKIEMRDNVAVAGGTSFALYDLFLYDDVGYNPDVPVGSFHGEFNYHSEITKQTESYKYYYNSAWFFRNSYDYHHPLVKMSIRTAMAGAYTTDEHIKYLYEHELGFTDYEAHYPTPTEDTIGYAIARKNLIKDGNSISVIAVTVRGGGYLAEWADNFRVGMGLTANHQGFSESADQVYAGILSYINYNREKLNDEIKVWVCGYSRAAAVSNLCARKLNIQGIPNTDIEPNDVFAFCFECPNSTTDSQANNQLYSNIRCFVNPIDLVPMVPFGNPLTWGFQRYGTTYFYPSASTRWNYREYKKWMKVEYESILDSLSGGHENVMEYTKEIKNQANSMNTFTAACSTALSRENYVYFAEDRIMDLAKSILGKPNSDKNDVIEFLTRVSTAYNPVNVFEIISNIESIMYAHYPELSLAWLDSLDGVDDFKIAYSKVVVTTVKPAIPWPWNNMRTAQTYENAHPLSIEVIDAEGDTVAVFSNGSFEELIDEEGIDYGICAYIDNNDQLCFDLPGDNNYSVIITSDIDAEVAVTMSTLTGELHTPEKLAAYFDVALSAGDTCTGIVENINENDEPYSLFVNGEEIEPSADLNEGDQIEHLVDVEVEGGGRVYFPGTFVTGEYAKLRVAFNEENFLGWYLDGELLSTAPEYRIMVTEDMLITAKFSTKLGDVNLDGNLSIADTILIARYALGLIELEAPCDLDGNRLVSIADAIVSARYALGLMEP